MVRPLTGAASQRNIKTSYAKTRNKPLYYRMDRYASRNPNLYKSCTQIPRKRQQNFVLEGHSLGKKLDTESRNSLDSAEEGHSKLFNRKILTYEKIETFGMKEYNVPTGDDQSRKVSAFRYHEPISKKSRESVFEE